MTTVQSRKEELTALLHAANIIAAADHDFFYNCWEECRAAVTREMALATIHNGCTVSRSLVEDAIATLFEMGCKTPDETRTIVSSLQAQLDAL